MCNRIVQNGQVVKPGKTITVLLKGPGGEFELPIEAIFGGPARKESRNHWIKRERAEPSIVPDVERFGEKDKTTGQQNWEDVPAGSSLEGLLLPTPPGKAYRLLKIVTQAATADQIARLGNDRAPILTSSKFPNHPPAREGFLLRGQTKDEQPLSPPEFDFQIKDM